MDYYGDSYDRLWELKMEPQGSRIEKRRLRALVLQLTEDAVVEYLLKYRAQDEFIRCDG